ncbi:extracellular catalytic domain type 1 short-chain-length polyhydroxyalkanoate depolymerase [Pontibacter chinhatensis]|uniref:Polyhydroxybutyrate depolymerase n=1 Tax=Pontibacter chinhatensis TaxID=1436961 RepID=A0A1I2XLJ7_9BACT|nr:PHB depolymerase family esterase [Pontibacter chinhatensis]SFH14373.1 polyhydroxybutyrate depolymerase [Pontibacter chinhatensis]
MLKLFITAVLLTTVISVSAQVKSFQFEGVKRKYLVYLPASYQSDTTQSFPLVFNFHGGGMTVAEQMLYTRMNEAADKHHFIVVYPSGIKQDWNVGFEMSYQNGTNDIGYVKAILDSLKQAYRIDNKAVFATGLSRGGFFCHRLAAEMPDDFAAIASIGGPLPDSVKHFHQSNKKVSVMQVHGTADKVVKYDGKTDAYASAPATYRYWVTRNGLAGQKENKQVFNSDRKDNTSVMMQEVTNKNVTVSLVTIENGGHTWPGSVSYNIGYPLGNTTRDIDMNEIIWRFFRKNRKH